MRIIIITVDFKGLISGIGILRIIYSSLMVIQKVGNNSHAFFKMSDKQTFLMRPEELFAKNTLMGFLGSTNKIKKGFKF